MLVRTIMFAFYSAARLRSVAQVMISNHDFLVILSLIHPPPPTIGIISVVPFIFEFSVSDCIY